MKRKLYSLAFCAIIAGLGAQSKLLRVGVANTKFAGPQNKSQVIFEQDPHPVQVLYLPTVIDENNNPFISTDDIYFNTDVDVDKIQIIGNSWVANNLPETILGARVIIFEDNNGKPKGKPSSPANTVFYKDIAANDPA